MKFWANVVSGIGIGIGLSIAAPGISITGLRWWIAGEVIIFSGLIGDAMRGDA